VGGSRNVLLPGRTRRTVVGIMRSVFVLIERRGEAS